MPLDFSNQGPHDRNKQDLIDTLGNPAASEEDWVKASENLGAFKPKSKKETSDRKKLAGEIALLSALGLGICGLINFTQPAHHDSTQIPPPKAVPAQADIDFGPYMANLQRAIKHHWYPPKGNESKRVVVLFKIYKEGKLSDLRIDHSSGSAVTDKAALKAVEEAASDFKALPEGAPNNVDIQFTFDYNVWKQSGKNRISNDAMHGDSFSSDEIPNDTFSSAATQGDTFSSAAAKGDTFSSAAAK